MTTMWFVCVISNPHEPGFEKDGEKALEELKGKLQLPDDIRLFASPPHACCQAAYVLGGRELRVNVLPELDYGAERYAEILKLAARNTIRRPKLKQPKNKKLGKKVVEFLYQPLDHLYAQGEGKMLKSFGRGGWDSFLNLMPILRDLHISKALLVADWPWLPAIADASVETFMPRRRIRSAELRPYGGFRIDYPADPEKSPRVLVIPDDLDT